MSLSNTASEKQLECRRSLMRIKNSARIAMARFDSQGMVACFDVEHIAKELGGLLDSLRADGYLIDHVVTKTSTDGEVTS